MLSRFSSKHTIHHKTTKYHFSHVATASFTLCNLSLSTPNNSEVEGETCFTLQNHDGVLHFLGSFFFIKSILNPESNQENETLCVKGQNALHWWRPGSRFHTSTSHNSGHFTWFPRKNYNKSSRHGAQEQKEKEKEQE